MIAGGLIQEGLTLKFAGVTLYFSVPAITVICIIIGIIIGIVNGALIAKCKLAPFIVTLGTMYIGRGLANIRSGGNTFSSIKGQEATDRNLLEAMITKFMGKPVGLDTLAAAIGEDSGTIEDVYEPFLIQRGLIKRTPRGRALTAFAYEHMGYPVPEEIY